MSRWTVQVRSMVELNPFVTKGGKPATLSECVTKYCSAVNSDQNMWLKNYPIFDEDHRQELNEKIINHYLFNEIGMETINLWNYRFEEKMKLIMPKYNLMYKAYAQDFDLLQNFKSVKEYTLGKTGNNTENKEGSNSNDRTQNNTVNTATTGRTEASGRDDTVNSTNTNGNNHSDTITSEFPQANIKTGDYATNEVDVTQSNSSHYSEDIDRDFENSSSSTGTQEQTANQTNKDTGTFQDNKTGSFKEDNVYHELHSGYNQYPVELLLKYLEFIQNIDEMIINDLGDLFMLIY